MGWRGRIVVVEYHGVDYWFRVDFLSCRANFVSDNSSEISGRGSVSCDVTTLVLENERRHVCGCKNIFGLKLQMGRVGQVEIKTTESKLELKVSLVVQPFLFSPVLPLWVSGLHLAAGVHLELEHGLLDH